MFFKTKLSMDKNTLLTRLGFQDTDHKSSKHDSAIHFVRQPEMIKQIYDTFCSHLPTRLPNDLYSIPGELAQTTMEVDCNRYITESPITKGHAQYKQTIGFVDGVIYIERKHIIKYGYQPIIFEVTPDELESLKNGELERYPGAFCLPDVSPIDWVGISSQIGISIEYHTIYTSHMRLPPQLKEMKFSLHDSDVFSYQDGDVFSNHTYIRSCKQLVKGHIRIDNYILDTDLVQWNFETKFHKTSAADIIRQVKLYREYKDREYYHPTEIFWFTLTFFDLSDMEQSELFNADIKWIRMGSKFDMWWDDQQRIPKKARLIL